jgi:two-component system, LuxR family, sensor kinase FixL
VGAGVKQRNVAPGVVSLSGKPAYIMYQVIELLPVVRKYFSKLGLVWTILGSRSAWNPAQRNLEALSKQKEDILDEVSQLKRSLESLRLSEALHRSIVASVVDAILVVDDQAVIVNMNPAVERMFGYSDHEIIGWRIHILIPEFTLELQDKSFETVGRRKDGRIFHMEVDLSDVVVEDCHQFVVVGRDITQRTELKREVLAISWREQARIGQDLHDTICQYLVGIQFMCSVLVERLAAKELSETPSVKRIAELTGQALSVARRIAHGLFPVELKEDGLELALKEWASQQESQFGVTVLVHCPSHTPSIDNETATHLFRIAQEAANNAIRHGKATHLDVDLAISDETTSLTVQDNGRGFLEGSGGQRGMGLNIMKYRATIIGGTLSIQRANDGGTTVVCSLTTPKKLSQKAGKST